MFLDAIHSASNIIPNSGFWSLLAFIGELLLATLVYVFKLERRKYWWAWLILWLAIIISFSYVWSLIPNYTNARYGNAITISFSVLYFSIMFTMLSLMILFIFKVDGLSSIFLATAGYSSQHFTYKFIQIIVGSIKSNVPEFQNNYAGIYSIYVTMVIISIPIFYFTFGRTIHKHDKINIEDRRLLIISVILLLCTIILNLINETLDDLQNIALLITGCLFDMVCCFLTLFIEFEMLNTKKMSEAYLQTKTIWESEKKQLEISKENMDYIRIIAHDLKHELKQSSIVTSDRVEELEHRLATFGNSIKTGNDILDLVIAERSLLMQRERINLSVIADGTVLSILSNSDCYSLFMNILDNAIDAVKEIKNRSREISLSVRQSMGMILINEMNPYKGELKFTKEGLPMTTKGDSLIHGLGTKSIKTIVEKYNGTYEISTDTQGVYIINIMIPMN